MKDHERPPKRTLATRPPFDAHLSRRSVVLEGTEYVLQLRRSESRVDFRFDTPYYAVVELPGQWYAVVPAPTTARDVEHLWHREMIELVDRAHRYVGMRRGAA